MFDSLGTTKQYGIVTYAGVADMSGDFAQGGGWGNENNEIGPIAVTQLVRRANIVRQSDT